MSLTQSDIYKFLQWHHLMVVATAAPSGNPEAALVEFAVTERLEVLFDTVDVTRKCHNLRASGRVACVVGWDGAETLQLEGVADEPSGEELDKLLRVYFEGCPKGLGRQGWPGLTYFRIRPTWARLSNYNRPKHIEEVSL